MSSERLMILNMVSDGKLTVDEASLLLESIARLETNDPDPSEETSPKTEAITEPMSDTYTETVLQIEQEPDSIEEQTPAKRNVWESVKQYLQRFRQPHRS